MKAFTDRDPRRIGIGALVVVVAMVAGVFLFNGSVFARTFSVHAVFAQDAGLRPGDQVRVAGVKVGTVGSIAQHGNTVSVELKIDDGVDLPRDSRAAISVQTLLGLIGVDITAGNDWAHPLRPGALIVDTNVPYEFYEIQTKAGTLFGQSDAAALNQLITDLAGITQGKEAQVHQIIDGLARFTQTIDQHQGQVGQLIDAAAQLSANLANRDQQLSDTLGNLDTVVSGLAANNQALGNLIDGTESAASQVSRLVGSNQPQLDAMLANLHTDLAVVNRHQLDLAQGIAYLASGVTGFASTGYSGPSNSTGNWANIFVDPTAQTGAYTVTGSCGLIDQALDQVLGPDPLPCIDRTGPLPSGIGQAAPPPPSPPGSPGGGTGAVPGAPAASGAPANQGDGVGSLIAPLLGAGR